MNQRALLLGKLALVALVIVGGFALAAMGKLAPQVLFQSLAQVVGELVIALGLVSGGSAAARAFASKPTSLAAADLDERARTR